MQEKGSCPYCSEEILLTAKKCRFCGEWLDGRKKKTQRKSLVLGVMFIILFGIGVSLLYNRDLFSQSKPLINVSTQTIDEKEVELRKTADELITLYLSKDPKKYELLYRNYYAPEHSVYENFNTAELFIESLKDRDNSPDKQYSSHQINFIKVDSNTGYVNRTISFCTDPQCTNQTSTSTETKKYIYVTNRWLLTDQVILCTRDEPFSKPPEFDRAISLIEQRSTNSLFDISLFRNCLNIQYSTEESEMDGAEGLFYFTPSSTPEELNILVSPRYKVKDDLITAILLVHETTHAQDYLAELNYEEKYDCYMLEARAFYNQNWFITRLNPEEKQSLNSRLRLGGSEELRSIKSVWDIPNTSPGDDGKLDTLLNYVKTSPLYQAQCNTE